MTTTPPPLPPDDERPSSARLVAALRRLDDDAGARQQLLDQLAAERRANRRVSVLQSLVALCAIAAVVWIRVDSNAEVRQSRDEAAADVAEIQSQLDEALAAADAQDAATDCRAIIGAAYDVAAGQAIAYVLVANPEVLALVQQELPETPTPTPQVLADAALAVLGVLPARGDAVAECADGTFGNTTTTVPLPSTTTTPPDD